ncbi:hypothetical protein CGCA056_v003629 [Colletotrichum aenigma]|uniref:uncharacterized protein n=1 Tax=Colletotrichum aenigma TaxID=1215731 RepID=UPI0018725681|nr:uncharacterized protein CGCA056_v003629 [Colletotrichum aenigma]KAF5526321.1 hypothetical protein CGCA056_v003629 [Colletotrichum aenigma]
MQVRLSLKTWEVPCRRSSTGTIGIMFHHVCACWVPSSRRYNTTASPSEYSTSTAGEPASLRPPT